MPVTWPNSRVAERRVQIVELRVVEGVVESAPNLRFAPSLKRKFLNIERLKFTRPGPRMAPSCALPKASGAGAAKAEVLKNCETVPG